LTGADRAGIKAAARAWDFKMENEYEDRKQLTFEQAEGAESLPSQLELRQVSQELRARLWSIFYKALRGNSARAYLDDDFLDIQEPVLSLLYAYFVERWCRAADEFTSS
jgi:hypothetical protein